jgi:hypothetical protein
VNSNKKFLLGLGLGLSLLSAAASAQNITITALSYNSVGARGRLLYINRTYTVVTTSEDPKHTYTLENNDYHLVPGTTYTGEWAKRGKKLKVHVLAGYYGFSKKRETTITLKVVGEGILP